MAKEKSMANPRIQSYVKPKPPVTQQTEVKQVLNLDISQINEDY